jgi:GNAT superfamily N-acetyltransferase
MAQRIAQRSNERLRQGMTSNIAIRPIAAEDFAHWAPLWLDYLAFYGVARDAGQVERTFARYRSPNQADMRGWIAWDGAQALGLAHVIVHAHGWQDEPVSYLQDLFTTPKARGQGIGRALIETVYADADTAGRSSVYWLTQRGNAAARRLYDTVARPTDFMKYARDL